MCRNDYPFAILQIHSYIQTNSMAPITLINARPNCITREQLDVFQASTPASGEFAHEPLLHLLQSGVSIRLEPSIQGLDLDKSGEGEIYITEAALSFFDPSSSRGFSVPYPTISLHAVSRQPVLSTTSSTSPTKGDISNGHPDLIPCVYCQLDENEGADYDNLAEDDLVETKELYLIPEDPAAGK